MRTGLVGGSPHSLELWDCGKLHRPEPSLRASCTEGHGCWGPPPIYRSEAGRGQADCGPLTSGASEMALRGAFARGLGQNQGNSISVTPTMTWALLSHLTMAPQWAFRSGSGHGRGVGVWRSVVAPQDSPLGAACPPPPVRPVPGREKVSHCLSKKKKKSPSSRSRLRNGQGRW